MSQISFFVICLAMFASNQARAAEWVRARDSDEGDTLYYDASSIRTYSVNDRDISEIGYKILVARPKGELKNIVEIKGSVEFDCKRYSYRDEAVIYKFDDGSWSDAIYNKDDKSFNIISEGNAYNILYEYACK